MMMMMLKPLILITFKMMRCKLLLPWLMPWKEMMVMSKMVRVMKKEQKLIQMLMIQISKISRGFTSMMILIASIKTQKQDVTLNTMIYVKDYLNLKKKGKSQTKNLVLILTHLLNKRIYILSNKNKTNNKEDKVQNKEIKTKLLKTKDKANYLYRTNSPKIK